MAERYEVIGKKEVRTKAGRAFYNYYLARPFTPYENDNAVLALGRAVEVEGSGQNFEVKPGDIVELSYSKGYQDKATLSGMTVVKPHIK